MYGTELNKLVIQMAFWVEVKSASYRNTTLAKATVKVKLGRLIRSRKHIYFPEVSSLLKKSNQNYKMSKLIPSYFGCPKNEGLGEHPTSLTGILLRVME